MTIEQSLSVDMLSLMLLDFFSLHSREKALNVYSSSF